MNERIAQLAEALNRHGVRALFGVPGSGLSWQLISALDAQGVPFWDVSHEAAGAIMAGALGQQTDTVGCSLSIKGPGFANMLAGIVSNQYEQWATLSISEAFGPATPAFRMHKRLDHPGLLSSVTKAYGTLGDPGETVAQLVSAAQEEIPGPVHLDLFAENAAELQRHRTIAPESSDGVAQWDLIRQWVQRARRPVVIAGSLSTRATWSQRLPSLKIPVFTTVAAKGVIDEQTPWAAGIYTGDGKALSPEQQVLPQADLVIGLGLRNLEVLSPRRFSCPLVIVDAASPRTAAGFEPEAVLTTGDETRYEELLDGLADKSWDDNPLPESLTGLRRFFMVDEWLPGAIFGTLEDLLPESSCLVVDTGSFCTVAEHLWRARTTRSFLASANGRSMGTGLPMAIGAALAERTRPTVCALGDGGIKMYPAELKLAIVEALPLLILFLTDGRYGSIAAAASAPNLCLQAITMRQPSWFRAVEAMGCAAASVTSLDALVSHVRQWDWNQGPLFLEATFDPERYAAMTAEIR
jgi:acetolactate synthase I/II/III large subunit